MGRIRAVWICLAVPFILGSCKAGTSDYRERAADPELFHASVKKLTDVTVHDIFSPPQASRTYAYPTIAAYEALVPFYPEYRTLAGQLNGLSAVPAPDPDQSLDPHIASLQAFLVVSRALVFSESEIEAFTDAMHSRLRSYGVQSGVMDNSIAYGNAVAEHILSWSEEDNYRETRSYTKYEVSDDPSRWSPTPPGYLDAIEPHWDQLRPFVMDSASQFQPPSPTPYAEDTASLFFQEAKEVFDTGNSLDAEQQEIAAFWDCNPYVMHTRGHAMFATKKITPGGHWIGITAIANRLENADFARSVYVYARVSIALADAFIASWDEKYRSDLVRPETYINRFIDDSWLPILQTPPFPEYTSGHSVISTAAAIVLTDIYGDSFAFEDTTEVEFGLPTRSFSSFIEASHEAAISRLYGGIHYMPAIENGIDQGRGVGRLVLERVEMYEPGLASAAADPED